MKIKKKINWEKSLCDYKSTVKDVLENLNKTGLKISLIHKNRKLIGTVTDGDIRKALLSNKKLKDKIIDAVKKNPVSVFRHRNEDDMIKIMDANQVDQLPIIDRNKKIVNLFVRNNLQDYKKNLFVIMAGGYGTRLRPYTKKTPKPLLKIKNKEIIRHIIDRAVNFKFQNFVITTFYKKGLIKKVLKKKYDFKFKFTNEKKPLGTAGPLSLIEKPKTSFIVSNSDILTNVNFDEMLNFHYVQKADATIVLKKIQSKNPYGEVKINGLEILDFYEKKVTEHFAIAGIYVFSPKVLKKIKQNENLDMISFLKKLKKSNYKIIAFPAHENWVEVGIMENFKKMR